MDNLPRDHRHVTEVKWYSELGKKFLLALREKQKATHSFVLCWAFGGGTSPFYSQQWLLCSYRLVSSFACYRVPAFTSLKAKQPRPPWVSGRSSTRDRASSGMRYVSRLSQWPERMWKETRDFEGKFIF